MNKHLIRRTALVAAAGTASFVLAACGSNDDAPTGHGSSASATASAAVSQGEHNAADIAFAKGMIPHHRQAVQMAGLAANRAQSAEITTLAGDIKKAQDPEIKTMSGWLTSWGEQVPAEGVVDHSMHGMDGMMTAEDMDSLKKTSGKAFDTAFLEMMIKHHEGAVEMAKTEKADGSFPDAKKMADAIITSQSAEITRMKSLLDAS
ncbi:DUF305 domain-containing protein [[Kitasatospora] papulosa]|uniref:DUF305 domain-containing protein n=1 Tax=[Kitasatospora] papulosa TaxID=1464011 RepID=UPI003687C49C